jgi:hypothetical protein
MDGAICSVTLTPTQYCDCGSCRAVTTTNLADQISDAKRIVEGWPEEVRRALGLAESRPRLVRDPTRPRDSADAASTVSLTGGCYHCGEDH